VVSVNTPYVTRQKAQFQTGTRGPRRLRPRETNNPCYRRHAPHVLCIRTMVETRAAGSPLLSKPYLSQYRQTLSAKSPGLGKSPWDSQHILNRSD
jgi:hypothetical protein